MTEKEKIIKLYQDILKKKRARFPNYFFQGDQGKQYLTWITRYLIEEYLMIPVADIPHQISARILWGNRLKPPADMFGWNFFGVIENAYPCYFFPWDFKQVPHGHWQGDEGRKRIIDAIRYFIEIKYKIPLQEVPQKVNYHFFIENRLAGIFDIFDCSPFKVIDAVYPGRFNPWEFANVPLNFWKDGMNIKPTMDWFLFEKIGFSSYKEAFIEIKKYHIFQYRLSGFFQMVFGGRLYRVRQWIKEQCNKYDEKASSTRPIH